MFACFCLLDFDRRPQVATTGCALKNNVISAVNYDKRTTIQRQEQALPYGDIQIKNYAQTKALSDLQFTFQTTVVQTCR